MAQAVQISPFEVTCRSVIGGAFGYATTAFATPLDPLSGLLFGLTFYPVRDLTHYLIMCAWDGELDDHQGIKKTACMVLSTFAGIAAGAVTATLVTGVTLTLPAATALALTMLLVSKVVIPCLAVSCLGFISGISGWEVDQILAQLGHGPQQAQPQHQPI